MDEFEIELKRGFLEEATQLLADAEQCFLGLEANPHDTALLEKIFRLAHNLKGSSKAVGFDQLGSFTHEFESFFLKIKNKQIQTSPEVVSLLLRCNDQIRVMVEGLKEDLAAQFDLNELLTELQNASSEKPAEASPAEVAALEESVAMSVIPSAEAFQESSEPSAEAISEALEAEKQVLAVSEEHLPEMLENITKLPETPASVATPIKSAPKVNAAVASAQSEESIRVSLVRLEKLINFVGEMSILQTVLQEQIYGSNPQLLRKTAHQLGKVCKEVQDISMSLRMVPVKQTFQKMQRIVRDTIVLLEKR